MIANLKSAERGKSPAGGVPTMLKQAEIDEKLIHKLKNTKSTSGSSALIEGLMQQNGGMPAEQFQSSGLEMIGFNPYTSYPGYDQMGFQGYPHAAYPMPQPIGYFPYFEHSYPMMAQLHQAVANSPEAVEIKEPVRPSTKNQPPGPPSLSEEIKTRLLIKNKNPVSLVNELSLKTSLVVQQDFQTIFSKNTKNPQPAMYTCKVKLSMAPLVPHTKARIYYFEGTAPNKKLAKYEACLRAVHFAGAGKVEDPTHDLVNTFWELLGGFPPQLAHLKVEKPEKQEPVPTADQVAAIDPSAQTSIRDRIKKPEISGTRSKIDDEAPKKVVSYSPKPLDRALLLTDELWEQNRLFDYLKEYCQSNRIRFQENYNHTSHGHLYQIFFGDKTFRETHIQTKRTAMHNNRRQFLRFVHGDGSISKKFFDWLQLRLGGKGLAKLADDDEEEASKFEKSETVAPSIPQKVVPPPRIPQPQLASPKTEPKKEKRRGALEVGSTSNQLPQSTVLEEEASFLSAVHKPTKPLLPVERVKPRSPAEEIGTLGKREFKDDKPVPEYEFTGLRPGKNTPASDDMRFATKLKLKSESAEESTRTNTTWEATNDSIHNLTFTSDQTTQKLLKLEHHSEEELKAANLQRMQELHQVYAENQKLLENWVWFDSEQITEIKKKTEFVCNYLSSEHEPHVIDHWLVAAAKQTVVGFQEEIHILRMGNRFRRALETAATPLKVEMCSIGSLEFEGIRKTTPTGDYLVQFLKSGPLPADDSVIDEIVKLAVRTTEKPTDGHKIELSLQKEIRSEGGVLQYLISSPQYPQIMLNIMFPPASALKPSSPPAKCSYGATMCKQFPFKQVMLKNREILWTVNVLLRIWRYFRSYHRHERNLASLPPEIVDYTVLLAGHIVTLSEEAPKVESAEQFTVLKIILAALLCLESLVLERKQTITPPKLLEPELIKTGSELTRTLLSYWTEEHLETIQSEVMAVVSSLVSANGSLFTQPQPDAAVWFR